MAVTFHFPTVLAPLTGGHRAVEASGSTVGAAVNDLSARFPQLAPRLKDEKGEPYAFVTFYLNDEDIRLHGGFSAAITDGDEVTIVPAIAGG
jgi:molybdopterin converting factor small subunit